MKTITATRYVTPLREGGSLPAIVEGSDLGLYVLKFKGAGQGVKTLVAELIAGELARALGLRVPELAFVKVDAALGRNEPDSEIRELLKKSVGMNLALDYLPGSITFDPLARPTPRAEEASQIVWFDAWVMNVDRTARNPNLLCWHKQLHLIDHGAALYVHHNWDNAADRKKDPFPAIKDHVLLPWASELKGAAAALRAKLSNALIEKIVADVPDDWLEVERAQYVDFLCQRLESSDAFTEEAVRARSQLV